MKHVLMILILFVACRSNRSQSVIKNPTTDSSITFPHHLLKTIDDLDILINDIGDAQVVMLGESTHGTHEFYKWRTEITKRLITEKGFDFVAIEGDWTDTYNVNQFINGSLRDSLIAIEVLKSYTRWPASMWANQDFAELVYWLSIYNNNLFAQNKISLYGIDVYSFWKWTHDFVSNSDPALKKLIERVRADFDSFGNDALKYSAAIKSRKINYSKSTQALFDYINNINRSAFIKNDFLLHQQALLTLYGERYFKAITINTIESWNIRETYMANTIQRLLDLHGNKSKTIIWVHNGHAGDSRFSQMAESGYTSVGQILKEKLKIYSIAFGTNKGSVYAGYSWNAPLQVIAVPAARKGSWENILHESSPVDCYILSREISNDPVFNKWLPFRSIGAAYSNNAIYGTALLPKRFDALVYIDSTTAIEPLR